MCLLQTASGVVKTTCLRSRLCQQEITFWNWGYHDTTYVPDMTPAPVINKSLLDCNPSVSTIGCCHTIELLVYKRSPNTECLSNNECSSNHGYLCEMWSEVNLKNPKGGV